MFFFIDGEGHMKCCLFGCPVFLLCGGGKVLYGICCGRFNSDVFQHEYSTEYGNFFSPPNRSDSIIGCFTVYVFPTI